MKCLKCVYAERGLKTDSADSVVAYTPHPIIPVRLRGVRPSEIAHEGVNDDWGETTASPSGVIKKLPTAAHLGGDVARWLSATHSSAASALNHGMWSLDRGACW